MSSGVAASEKNGFCKAKNIFKNAFRYRPKRECKAITIFQVFTGANSAAPPLRNKYVRRVRIFIYYMYTCIGIRTRNDCRTRSNASAEAGRTQRELFFL